MAGTRKAIPVRFTCSEGMTLINALVAPAEEGIMLPEEESTPPLPQ